MADVPEGWHVVWMNGKPGNLDQMLAAVRDSGQSRDYLVGCIAGVASAALSFAEGTPEDFPFKQELLQEMRWWVDLWSEVLQGYDEELRRHMRTPLRAAAEAHWNGRRRQGGVGFERWEDVPEEERQVLENYLLPAVQAGVEQAEMLRREREGSKDRGQARE